MNSRELLDLQRTYAKQQRRHLSELKKTALDNVVKQFYQKLYRQRLRADGCLPGIPSSVYENSKNLALDIRRKNKNYCRFITISLPPTFTLIQVQKTMSAVLKKKWITTYYYCLEQRGKTLDTMGDGLHIHLLILNPENSKRKSQIVRELAGTFRIAKNFIDVKQGGEIDFDKFLTYMRGEKKDETKLDAVLINVKWRQKNNLDLIYTNAY